MDGTGTEMMGSSRARALRVTPLVLAVLLGGSLAIGMASAPAYAGQATAGPATSAVERSLGGVSCVGQSFCLGVGPDQDTEFATPAFSQVWNGKAWLAPVAVPSAPANALLSVSCVSSKNCLAVGGSLGGGSQSDAWNGKTWRQLPVLDRSQGAVLYGVDCPAANRCLAVGGAASGFWAQLWNGTSWIKLTPAVPAGATLEISLNAVSCTGAAHCVVVGAYDTGKGEARISHALAESWNGSSWTLLPAPPAGLTGLQAVSCPTATQCVVLGTPVSQAAPGSAVLNGSTWTSLTTPSASPTPTNQFLSGISCASVSNCMAVGQVPGPFGPGAVAGPVAERWTGGSSWQLLSVPDPAGISFAAGGDEQEDSYLNAVSCTGAASCVAVGGDGDFLTVSSYASFAVAWNGSTWKVLPAGQVDGLLGVSCYSSSHCLLTGTYLSRTDQTLAMAQTWHGTGVRIVSKTGLPGVLSGVSCVSSTFCMADGEGDAIDRWNGNRWTVSTSSLDPSPSQTGPVSCVSRDFCMVLGEFWNGSKWQLRSLVQHQGAQVFTILSGLSCTRPTFCLAVGFWGENDSANGGTVAELWNGKRWQTIHSPGDAGGAGTTFNAVSCVTATDCMVIGGTQADGDEGPVHVIAEQWNGRTWHLTHPPGRFGPESWNGGGIGPSDISCPTATSCMAVGSVGLLGERKDVALSWNGRTWRSTKVPGPSGLRLVSCAAAGHCLAIAERGIRTLAKAWNGRTWHVIRTINP